ncbi:hypothetical protein V8G54_033322 [Vigna mungo]|uniref:Uncharacterized protein n=1 Tax=Vigna mungo TaxID=3915 RepID=A0AAQ3MP48_VIGMU
MNLNHNHNTLPHRTSSHPNFTFISTERSFTPSTFISQNKLFTKTRHYDQSVCTVLALDSTFDRHTQVLLHSHFHLPHSRHKDMDCQIDNLQYLATCSPDSGYLCKQPPCHNILSSSYVPNKANTRISFHKCPQLPTHIH